jgi:5-methylcytosine-specific restriction endonuclease McrA
LRLRTKVCVQCGEEKKASEFIVPHGKRRDKLGVCRDCRNLNQRQRDAERRGFIGVAEKLCRECGETKRAFEFNLNPRSNDGLKSICKVCEREYFKPVNRRHRQKPEVREKRLAYTREWRKSHPEDVRESRRKWCKGHPGYSHVRKARVREGDLTQEEWEHVVSLFDSRCAYCGEKLQKPHIDHVIPLSRGGLHTMSNVVPACVSCNSRKHAQTPEEAGMEIIWPVYQEGRNEN